MTTNAYEANCPACGSMAFRYCTGGGSARPGAGPVVHAERKLAAGITPAPYDMRVDGSYWRNAQ